MPSAKYAGSESGTGNPPGQYSKGYLSGTEGSNEGHFLSKKSYRGSMNVGISDTASQVGNQPKENKTASLEGPKTNSF